MGILRIGIVGMGNAGMMHARSIIDGKIPNAILSAVCDQQGRLNLIKDKVPAETHFIADYDEMLAGDFCDAVIIATPHFQHPELSIKAFKAGLHVFCEKPAGVSIGPVQDMNQAARDSGKIFCMHFNRRLEPVFQKLHEMITQGELGTIFRVNWTATNWYRSDTYFNSAEWRGTWAGEGGGVMINQCIHNLDIWQYLFGKPDRIKSFCRFGKHHNIEVEDEVTAFMEYDNGISGVFIAGTGESPGTDRLEIACSHGKIIVENKNITCHRTTEPIEEFNRKNTSGFGEPECKIEEIPISGQADLSGGMLKNFVDAVLEGVPLLVNGEEGIDSLELENAILLSAWRDEWVEFPVDPEVFDRELNKHVITSRKKEAPVVERIFDLKDSFK